MRSQSASDINHILTQQGRLASLEEDGFPTVHKSHPESQHEKPRQDQAV